MSRPIILALFAVLLAGGLADAVYLTWDHGAHVADPDGFGGGLCGEGEGCDISRDHWASEIPLPGDGPGVPISVLGGAFYLAFAALLWARARRPEDATPRRLALGLSALAVAYSIALASISLAAQGALCTFCAVLYGVNVGLFALSAATLGEPARVWLRRVWSGAMTKVAAVTALVFVATAASGYAVYRGQLGGADAAEIINRDDVVALDTAERYSKGPADAPVHIVEFSDIQCPFCKRLFDTIEEVHAARPDLIRVTFMHFPLDTKCNPMMKREFHDMACDLAAIAECAGRQGRFWEVTDTLFEHDRGDSLDAIYARVADTHGDIDVDALKSCVDQPETLAAIRSDLKHGAEAEITGTPVFFVNGHKISGAKSRAFIDELVDAALEGRAPDAE